MEDQVEVYVSKQYSIISKINNYYCLLRMRTRHRSRDSTIQNKTGYSKSMMKGSVETKQQSTCRNSPKPIKNRIKTQKKPKDKEKVIKSVDKLNQFVKKLSNKLQSFEEESINISLKTSIETSQSSKKRSRQSEISYMDLKQSQQTAIICEEIKNLKNLIKVPHSQHNQRKIQQKSQFDYNKIFDTALAKPNCWKKIKLNHRKGVGDILNSALTLQQQIRCFKQSQNQNWAYLNKKLYNLLGNDQNQLSQDEKKSVMEELKRQGRANYRWIQIQQKMNMADYELIDRIDQRKNRENLKKKKQKEIQDMYRNDQPLGSQICLKNYNWEQYVWEDGSQSEDLLNNSDKFHINSADVLQQSNEIQEKVDMIMCFLLDEFVVELANKLDLNSFLKITSASRDIQQTQYQEDNQNPHQNYEMFFKRINQIAADCQQVDSIGTKNEKQISPIIVQALIEIIKSNPQLSSAQSKKKLKDIICNREFDISQLIKLQDREDYEWIRLSFMAELDQIIFQGIIMQQVCKLRMG